MCEKREYPTTYTKHDKAKYSKMRHTSMTLKNSQSFGYGYRKKNLHIQSY